MAFVQAKLSDPGVPVHQRQRALDRALSDPGVPSSYASTKSFWLNECDKSLATKQSPSLPSTADVVIIGSGITGISVAHSILEGSDTWTDSSDALPKPRVLILEARDFCSGATGRNGGHILETADEFVDLETTYGLEAARKLTKFRLSQRAALLQVAEKFGISDECQARSVEFVGAYFDEEAWQDAKVRVRRLKSAMPKETEAWKTLDRGEIHEVSFFSDASFAYF
jgi:glycine/D-amino acid oxidase-like deaminating enzyme